MTIRVSSLPYHKTPDMAGDDLLVRPEVRARNQYDSDTTFPT